MTLKNNPAGAKYDLQKEEYNSLREEIHKNNENVLKLVSGAFTVTGAAFAYLLSKDVVNPYVFLFPFIILTPSIFLITSQVISTKRIAAYIKVFIESEANIQWENRLVRLHPEIKRRGFVNSKRGILILYIISGIICALLYLLYKNRDIRFLDFVLISILLLIHFWAVYQYYRANKLWNDNDYIKHWERVKNDEDPKQMPNA